MSSHTDRRIGWDLMALAQASNAALPDIETLRALVEAQPTRRRRFWWRLRRRIHRR